MSNYLQPVQLRLSSPDLATVRRRFTPDGGDEQAPVTLTVKRDDAPNGTVINVTGKVYEVPPLPIGNTLGRILWDSDDAPEASPISDRVEPPVVILDTILTAIATRATPADVQIDSTQFATALDTVLQVLAEVKGAGFDTTAASLMALRAAIGDDSGGGSDPSDWAQVKAKVLALGTSQFAIMAPVLSKGCAEIVRGGDYFASEARALTFDLTGSITETIAAHITMIEFIVKNRAALVVAATSTPTDDGIIVSVELNRTQTAALTEWDSAPFYLVATLDNARVIPLLSGTLTIKDGAN